MSCWTGASAKVFKRHASKATPTPKKMTKGFCSWGLSPEPPAIALAASEKGLIYAHNSLGSAHAASTSLAEVLHELMAQQVENGTASASTELCLIDSLLNGRELRKAIYQDQELLRAHSGKLVKEGPKCSPRGLVIALAPLPPSTKP